MPEELETSQFIKHRLQDPNKGISRKASKCYQ